MKLKLLPTSEGFNTLIKALQGWKDVLLDAIVQSMNMLQTYFLNKLSKGKAGLGNYTLKSWYQYVANLTEKLILNLNLKLIFNLNLIPESVIITITANPFYIRVL